MRNFLLAVSGLSFLVLWSHSASARVQLAELSPEIVRNMIVDMHSEDPRVRCSAAGAIGAAKVTPELESHKEEFFALVSDPDACVRGAISGSLGTLFPGDERAYFAGLKILDDPAVPEKWVAANTIASVVCTRKEDAAKYAPEIMKRFAASDRDVKSRFLNALGCTDSQGIVFLSRLLSSDEDTYVRHDAIQALGRIVSTTQSADTEDKAMSILREQAQSAKGDREEILLTIRVLEDQLNYKHGRKR